MRGFNLPKIVDEEDGDDELVSDVCLTGQPPEGAAAEDVSEVVAREARGDGVEELLDLCIGHPGCRMVSATIENGTHSFIPVALRQSLEAWGAALRLRWLESPACLSRTSPL